MSDTLKSGRNSSNNGYDGKCEFYSQFSYIERECCPYRKYFRGSTVFCNCDDPYESNFFKYFAINFNALGLKKLITTSYYNSKIAGTEIPLPGMDMDSNRYNDSSESGMGSCRHGYRMEISEVKDWNGDGAVDLEDVELLLRSDSSAIIPLEGDGDFRSPECVELLKQADIVVSSPPFTLIREYIEQIMHYDKKFLIVGSLDAVTYKDIFQYFLDGRMWTAGSNRDFLVPRGIQADVKNGRYNENGMLYVDVEGVRWFTNLECPRRRDSLFLWKTYNSEDYPRYDNYDAINVDRTADIPCDYDGVMGVPVSFLDKYDPDEFMIVGCTESREWALATGVWDESKGIHATINGKKLYKRIFIRRIRDASEDDA